MLFTSTSILILVLLVVAAINLRIIISTRLNWLFKTIATFATLVAILVSHIAVETIYGYPSKYAPKGEYTYLFHTIDEPKYIYVWLIPDENNLTIYEEIAVYISGDKDRPRVYTVPYSKEKHKQYDGIKKTANGKPLEVLIDGEERLEGIDIPIGTDDSNDKLTYVTPSTEAPKKIYPNFENGSTYDELPNLDGFTNNGAR